jgi:hypothetical protein
MKFYGRTIFLAKMEHDHAWARVNNVKLEFGPPGKLTDNPYIENFNGRLHAEGLEPAMIRAPARGASRDRELASGLQ